MLFLNAAYNDESGFVLVDFLYTDSYLIQQVIQQVVQQIIQRFRSF